MPLSQDFNLKKYIFIITNITFNRIWRNKEQRIVKLNLRIPIQFEVYYFQLNARTYSRRCTKALVSYLFHVLSRSCMAPIKIALSARLLAYKSRENVERISNEIWNYTVRKVLFFHRGENVRGVKLATLI
jgi:hypothetical protein